MKAQNLIIIFGIILIVMFGWYFNYLSHDKSPILSFEDCVDAGYPVMESYPERCAVPGSGKSFTRIFNEAECKAMSPDSCLGSCVVCPPCPECSSISCQTEEFCKNMGIDRSWYKAMTRPQNEEQVTIANPASVYCIEQGGRVEIRSLSDGSQNGVCIFPNGKECEEWQFYKGECETKENEK